MVRSRGIFFIPLGLAFGALLTATSAAQQHVPRPWAANVVVPQASCYTMGRQPAVRIEQVRAGVVIRGQVATTTVEIQLRNPGPGRLEAELHVYATGDHDFGVRQDDKLPSSWPRLCVNWLQSLRLLKRVPGK